MRLRRVGAVLVAGALLAGACSSDHRDKAQAAKQTSVVHPASIARLRLSGGDYGYPSPFAYVRGAGLIMCSYVFDTLLWTDSTGEPIPWLAKDFSHSADGLAWHFTLRDNAKWQDGQPVTADDVKFSFDYVTTGAAAGVSRFGSSLDLKDVTVDSPSAVTVHLNKPSAVFADDVAERLFIIPEHIWSAVSDPAKFRDPKALVGSGPYRLASEDEAAGSYLFTANDSFYLGSPYVKRIELVPAPDELLALDRDQIDAGELLDAPAPEAQIKAFESNPKYTELTGGYDFMMALHINLAKGFPWDRREYRQAIAYALDRKDMVTRLLAGRGEPETVGGLTVGHPDLAPDLPAYDHDVAKAKSLLDGLGLKDTNGDGLREAPDGAPFTQEIQANNRFSSKDAELIKEYLHDVGIDVKISILDKAVADDNAGKGNYTMALIGYGGMTGDPDQNLRSRYAASPKSTSFTRAIGYSDPQVTALANEQIATLDPAKRKDLVQQIQRIVAEDVPIIPLYTPQRMTFYKAGLFDNWYYTPGCTACRGTRNKHMLVTGKKTGF
ncbi:MAG TPA: ABC transporter substrate-binding protein [Acidimicrobiia bacterium]|nr:ABC transporter substrate-binding protein [Acidimicrobiia bacterium]